MPPPRPESNGPAIRTSQLAKKYGQQVAVAGIDLVVPSGQLIGLLGPNGAGKSTTIKMLTGMIHPTSGSAEVGGHDILLAPLEVKKIVGYVPETGAVFESLTGWEYLNLVASLYHIPERESAQRIERFRVFFDLTGTDLKQKKLGAYSKGMRQKVVITAALLHNPEIVFFDEPLNGLDANAALMFKTLITSLAKEGKTIVYCSHVLDVVERMVERVVIVHQGRILEDGTVGEILERSGERTLEQAFNRLTSTQNLLQKAEDFARALSQ
jgi:ABC-2 type transport system ATP-binding protein